MVTDWHNGKINQASDALEIGDEVVFRSREDIQRTEGYANNQDFDMKRSDEGWTIDIPVEMQKDLCGKRFSVCNINRTNKLFNVIDANDYEFEWKIPVTMIDVDASGKKIIEVFINDLF